MLRASLILIQTVARHGALLPSIASRFSPRPIASLSTTLQSTPSEPSDTVLRAAIGSARSSSATRMPVRTLVTCSTMVLAALRIWLLRSVTPSRRSASRMRQVLPTRRLLVTRTLLYRSCGLDSRRLSKTRRARAVNDGLDCIRRLDSRSQVTHSVNRNDVSSPNDRPRPPWRRIGADHRRIRAVYRN